MAKTPDQKIYIEHYVVQAWGVDKKLLGNKNSLLKTAKKLATELKLTIVNSFVHRFKPSGLSLILVLSQSHLAIHTWPEYGYLNIDVLSCSDETNLHQLEVAIKKYFNPSNLQLKKISY